MISITELKNSISSSQSFPNFEALILDFLRTVEVSKYPSILVSAIAGVFHGNEIKIANIHHWPVINVSQIKDTLSIINIYFINDLVAAA